MRDFDDMITSRKSGARAQEVDGGRRGWQSEAGFGSLESFREEYLAPGAEFRIELPADLEVLTYVREGALILSDPRGRSLSIEAGECHRSSSVAGTPLRGGNASIREPARVFQGFIRPDHASIRMPAEKRRFPIAERRGVLRLMSSRVGAADSLRLRQDVALYSAILDRGHHMVHELVPGRAAWLHVVDGRIRMAEGELEEGDGASIVEEPAVSFTALEASEVLLFDLGGVR